MQTPEPVGDNGWKLNIKLPNLSLLPSALAVALGQNLRKRRRARSTTRMGKPRQRLAYARPMDGFSIADYDHAMTQWLDGGRVGPRPKR